MTASPVVTGQVLPVVPVPTVVVFPGPAAPMEVSEPGPLAAVESAAAASSLLGLFRYHERPDADHLAEIGVSARIMHLVRLPGGQVRLIVQGVSRVRRVSVADREPALRLVVEQVQVPQVPLQGHPLRDAALGSFEEVVRLSPTIPDQVGVVAANLEEAGELADLIAAALDLPADDQQRVLDTVDPVPRLELALQLCEERRSRLQLSQQIREQVTERAGRHEREFLLREQLRAIQKELGELDPQEAEVGQLRRELDGKELPEAVRAEVDRDLTRLEQLPPASPEHAVTRTRLDWIAALPWGGPPPPAIDVEGAREILDADHFGLDKVKDRIIDHLAVTALRGGVHAPILCLVGPPGVGKTSLGQSVARAMERPFVRSALGGIRDEAEIRGHRRTYIGALPGRIIQGMRRAGSRYPVFMLDEVDKLGVGFQGDPAAALLEVLDPAQNSTFTDTYLDVPYDLSGVFFICTANLLDTVPGPLLDRMEVIQLSGYTEQEKCEIARRHLLPRQLEEHALPADALRLDDAALLALIRGWTREAGVRQLERGLAACCRKVARRRALGQGQLVDVTPELLTEWLGRPAEDSPVDEQSSVGAATGLAWTPVGGEVLTVEAATPRGSGRLTLTGHLGDVMQESARAAITCARNRSSQLGLPDDFFMTHDVHLHVPAGAVPKDGPSAGVTRATALVSSATGRAVDRTWAMTGEVTLRGHVLPVGGIKEKVLAARRAGLAGVVLPRRNERDLDDLPEEVREALGVRLAGTVDDVLATVLTGASGPGGGGSDSRDGGAAPVPDREQRTPVAVRGRR